MLTSVVFAENSKISVIQNFAFYNDAALTEIILPASVKNINLSAFNGSGLISITLKSATMVSLDSSSFANVTLKNIYVPSLLVENYKNNNDWSALQAEIQSIEE